MADRAYFVYHQAKIICVTADKNEAQESAEKFVLENKPLECEVLELAAISKEKYPKEAHSG